MMFSDISKALFISLILLILLLISGCAGLPRRPNVPVYEILVELDPGDGHIVNSEAYGYSLRDYDSDGNLIPGARPQRVPLKLLVQLQGWTCLDTNGTEAFKVWMAQVRKYSKERCK